MRYKIIAATLGIIIICSCAGYAVAEEFYSEQMQISASAMSEQSGSQGNDGQDTASNGQLSQ